jgi:heme exporter protein A
MPLTARPPARRSSAPASPETVERPPEPVVSLAGVGVTLGATPVLRNLDLQVHAGQTVGLVGANGSGKTTLLRVLATLLPPTSGGGSVLGARLDTRARFAVRPAIALVGHMPSLYPQLSLAENLELVARLLGQPHGRAIEALEAVGLAGARHRRAGHCSQGMLRRAAFARILLTKPRLLLLDEAHAGLDPAASELVELLAAEVRGRRGAAVVVSHEPRRLGRLVDRTLELAGGRLQPAAEVADAR